MSASRRTDIPALFGRWFERRLEEGCVEYIPAGPPRRVRRSLRTEDVTHFCFWSKWPRPFLPVLDRVLERGFPVLWNLTISGLGGSVVEPRVPPPQRAVAALREIAARVPPAAIAWRYDPIFTTHRFDAAHHRRTFARLAGELAGYVDRVVVSFVDPYERRVAPDLGAYEATSGDLLARPTSAARLDLLAELNAIARAAAIPLALCCSAQLEEAAGLPPAGCNSWSWACRVHPELRGLKPRRRRPTRPGCTCAEEFDIGVYDTCTLGCRYCYASRDESAARRRRALHDPTAPCILP